MFNNYDEHDQVEELSTFIPIDEHVEYVSHEGSRVTKKGIYLLPNLLTTAAMFCGFYAIMSSVQGMYEAAAIAIFSAMFFDVMDGRVARLVNAQSAFGIEFDSLSDLISFGAAPALVTYHWALFQLGKLGWVLAFIYMLSTALRLARFNTGAGDKGAKHFSGLASPASAALVISLLWLINDHLKPGEYVSGGALMFFALIVFVAGILMITNLKYYSFKGINIKGRVSYVFLLAIIFIGMLVAINPPMFLFVISLLYASSAPIILLFKATGIINSQEKKSQAD